MSYGEMITKRFIFPAGWRNPPRAWGFVCGLPDHHGEVLQGHRYHCAGNGECTKILTPDSMCFPLHFQSAMTIFVSRAGETSICLCWWCMFSLSPDDQVNNLPWRARWPCLSGDSGLRTTRTPRTPRCSHRRAQRGEKPRSLSYGAYGEK